jgi:hypothetical protein
MWTKLKQIISYIYVDIILYYAGAALTDEELEECKGGGDRLTYWFRRSKKRLGNLWWIAVIFTLIAVNFELYKYIKNKRWGMMALTILFDLFCLWLIPHICGVLF